MTENIFVEISFRVETIPSVVCLVWLRHEDLNFHITEQCDWIFDSYYWYFFSLVLTDLKFKNSFSVIIILSSTENKSKVTETKYGFFVSFFL